MFAGKRKDVVIDGGEDLGQVTVVIRMLSGPSLEKAAVQRAIVQAAQLRALGHEFVDAANKPSPELEEAKKVLAAEKKDPDAARKARYAQYDRDSILIAGIERWSCEDQVKRSPKAILELREDVAQKLHEETVDFSCGPLEATEAPKD